MAEILFPLLATSLLGALLALDQTAWGQFMLSRPLPAGFLLGAVLGEPQIGALAGVLYELLWVKSLPVGSHVPYLPLYPALLAVFLAGAFPRAFQSIPLAVVLALPGAIVNHRVDVLWRRTNDFLGDAAASFVASGRPRGARALHLLSLGRLFALHAGALFLCGLVLLGVYTLADSLVPDAGRWALFALPVPFFVGLASLWPRQARLRGWVWAAAGVAFLSGVLLGWGRRW